MGEEVELETLPEQRVGDLADAPLPGRTRIRHNDVDAAEALGDRSEGGFHLLGLGHVASKTEPLDGGSRLLRRLAVDIEHGDRSAICSQSLGRRGTDSARARHHRDLAGQRLHHRAFQLRLLQAPIFEREQIALRQRLVAADGLGIGDHLDRVLGEVCGDARILSAAPEAEQADAGHQHDSRAGIELGFDPSHGCILADEIGIVSGDELFHCLAHGGREILEPARLGGRQHERPVLGADDVVRRHHAALAVGGKFRAVHIGEDLGRGAEVGDEARGLGAAVL